MKTLGDHLRKKRLGLGLLQREVARELGVTPSTVGKWEGNATTPICHYTKAIVHFLDYNPFPTAKTLAERLILYRKTQGLSQRQFAKLLGVDQKTLVVWERGRDVPTKESLMIIEGFIQPLEKAD